MRNFFRIAISALAAAAMMLTAGVTASADNDPVPTLSGEPFAGTVGTPFIPPAENNPISTEVFCADPTSVEYNGRLYVYGTNDHEQCREKGEDEDNTYEKIKSLVIFSTEDMINWTYHGEINVGEIAPWIINSWAPSVTSRTEEDGLTHFYLYFSNNGTGVGVITSTDPLGPWSDPLGKPFITSTTEGLTDCPNPFDPGVVIDENGTGWLAFGGGTAKSGTKEMPGSARIVKLGDDMLSFASEFAEIPAPYFFEASELNYINGTYVYTYCSDWNNHLSGWLEHGYNTDTPGGCSMIYMKTKTPLDPESWEMGGECLKNPGECGFDYSNNHTHLHKYKGKWYMLYHTLSLRSAMGIKGGYRSLCADEIIVSEDTVYIEKKRGSKEGVTVPASLISPYSSHLGAELNNTADITFDTSDMQSPLAVSDAPGAWTSIKGVTFMADDSAMENLQFTANVRGTGRMEVRLDSPNGTMLTSLDFDTPDKFTEIYNPETSAIQGTHDLYFVFSDKDIAVRDWRFVDVPPVFDPLPIIIVSAAAVVAIGAVITVVITKRRKKPSSN